MDSLLADIEGDPGLLVGRRPADHRRATHHKAVTLSKHSLPGIPRPGMQDSISAGLIDQKYAGIIEVKPFKEQVDHLVQEVFEVKDTADRA